MPRVGISRGCSRDQFALESNQSLRIVSPDEQFNFKAEGFADKPRAEAAYELVLAQADCSAQLA